MAVTESTKKVTCALKLDAGTTESGATKTVSVSLGTLNHANWDASKAFSVAIALGRVLQYETIFVTKVLTQDLEEE